MPWGPCALGRGQFIPEAAASFPLHIFQIIFASREVDDAPRVAVAGAIFKEQLVRVGHFETACSIAASLGGPGPFRIGSPIDAFDAEKESIVALGPEGVVTGGGNIDPAFRYRDDIVITSSGIAREVCFPGKITTVAVLRVAGIEVGCLPNSRPLCQWFAGRWLPEARQIPRHFRWRRHSSPTTGGGGRSGISRGGARW